MGCATAQDVMMPPFHTSVLLGHMRYAVCLANHQHNILLSKVSISDLPYGRTLNKYESTVVT
jgi:hypothetical protein